MKAFIWFAADAVVLILAAIINNWLRKRGK